MKIPLFDIDGTLFQTGNSVNNDAFSYAVNKVFGITASHLEIDSHGKINNEILIEVLKLHGLTEKEIKEQIKAYSTAIAKYAVKHKKEMNQIVLPGVKKLLRKLKMLKIPAGLLTGNVEELAWAKTEATGLRDFLEFGAFGNMAYIRSDLVEIARKNAEKALNRKYKKEDFVIIGDTPRDCDCARTAGVRVILVATGKYSFDELAAEKPDLVVRTLEDPEVLNFLTS